jgi:hypothetical protein
MTTWYVDCVRFEDPNDRNSRITALGLKRDLAHVTHEEVDVQNLGRDIFAKAKDVYVPFEVDGQGRFSAVEAVSIEGQWIVRTVPDGLAPGNLRSVPSC